MSNILHITVLLEITVPCKVHGLWLKPPMTDLSTSVLQFRPPVAPELVLLPLPYGDVPVSLSRPRETVEYLLMQERVFDAVVDRECQLRRGDVAIDHKAPLVILEDVNTSSQMPPDRQFH